MNAQDLKDFRERFEKELRDLQKSAAAIKGELRESAEVNSQAHQDELDCAKGESDLNTQVEIYNHIVKRQSQIHAALGRIASGKFGFCPICEEGISSRRLHVQPCAALCFECQHYKETGFESLVKPSPFIPRWLGTPIPDLEKVA